MAGRWRNARNSRAENKKKQKSHSSNGEIYTKNVHNAIYLNIQIGNGKN